MKRGKGGLIAFLAAGVLMVNVAPAMADDNDLIEKFIRFVLDVSDKIVSGNGGDKIRCYSAAAGGGSGFVECSSCSWMPGVSADGDAKSKCTRN